MARGQIGGAIHEPMTHWQEFTDQYGRTWGAEVDNKNGHPLAQFKNVGWRAPWYCEQKYVVFDAKRPTKITWDHDQAFADIEQAHKEYHARALQENVKQGWHDIPHGGPYPAKLIGIIGTGPQPWQPYLAAKQGNQWILGLSPVVDERLLPFVTKVKPFIPGLQFLPDFGSYTAPAVETKTEATTKGTLTGKLTPVGA